MTGFTARFRTAPTATGSGSDPGAPWILLLGLAGAIGLGWYVSNHPDLLHLEGSLQLRTVVAGVCASVLLAGILRRPDLALVTLLSVVYLNLSDALIRAYGIPSILQLVMLPVLVSAWVDHGRGALERILDRPLTWGLVAYVLVLLASGSWAQQPDLAEERFVEAAKGLVLFGSLVVLVRTRHRARLAAWTLVGAAAFLGFLGVLHVVGGIDSDTLAGLARSRRGQIYGSVFDRRLAGPLGDPNYFAQILIPVVPLALFLAWHSSTRRLRLVIVGCLGLILTALVLTYSRGGALALGLVLIASLLFLGMDWRKIILGAAALTLAGTLFLPNAFGRRLNTVLKLLPSEDAVLVEVDSSVEERLLLVETAWTMFTGNPALGVGAGNYTARFGDYAETLGSTARDYEDPDAERFPHNLYLEVGAETGLLGLTVFLGSLLAAVLALERARLVFRDLGDPWASMLARSLQVGLAGYLATGIFLHGAFQRYLWIQLGLAGALGAMAASARREIEVGPGSEATPGSEGRNRSWSDPRQRGTLPVELGS